MFPDERIVRGYLQSVGDQVILRSCPMGADVQEEDIEMQGQKFNYKGQEWIVREVLEASDSFRSQLGWTHIAGVMRPKGTKVYYANLLVADGEIAQSLVVL